MKKYIIITMGIFILLLSGCQKETSKVTVTLPAGTPLVAVGGILEDLDSNIVAGPDLLVTAAAEQKSDIIIMPLINGAKLFLDDSSIYQLHAIITLDNNYIITKKSNVLNSITDLNGVKFAAYAEASTPGIMIKKIFEEYKIETKETNFYPAIGDLGSLFRNGTYDYILAAEPTISTLEANPEIGELNLLEVHPLVLEKTPLEFVPQAAIFVNPNSKNKTAVKHILAEIEKNIEYLNKNPEEYAKKIIDKNEHFKKLGEAVLAKSIKRSNITYLVAKDSVTGLEQFFQMLNRYNPKLLGNRIPESSFYYSI